MSRTENSQKSSLLAQIKPPYFCFIAVTDAGEYRISFGYVTPSETKEYYILCENIKELISFLRSVFHSFVSADALPNAVKPYGTPQILRAAWKTDKTYFAQDFEQSEQMSNKLLSMDADEFFVWEEGAEWAMIARYSFEP